MSKIISIGYLKDDAKLISPEECLNDCLENDLGKRDAFKEGKKLIVIALDDNDDKYSWSFNQAGMSASEIVALLEIVKKQIIDQYMEGE